MQLRLHYISVLYVGMLTVLLAGTSAGEPAQIVDPNPAVATDLISYQVSPEPLADRTNLNVTMTFAGRPSGQTIIKLPSDRYGTPHIWESISSLRAESAMIGEIDGDPQTRLLTHAPGANITIQYTISRGRDEDPGVAYRPSTDSTHFHYFGPQWRVRLGDRTGTQRYRFSFVDVPDGWSVFGNLGNGPGPYELVSTEEELSGFIAGGHYESVQFKVNGIPVGIYVSKAFDQPKQIVEATAAIIKRQGEIFGGFHLEFYNVSVTPRSGIRAGTAIDNAFVCLTDAKTSKTDLDVLIAHEAFHNWLPHSATIDCWKSGASVDEFRFDWFVEGFTEYVARRMLFDSGRLNLDEYVERFNEDLEEQAKNPMQRASLEEVRKALKDERYSNQHERTSYFRGPLIALAWDHQLRRQGKHTLLDVVQAFITQGTESGGEMDEDAFFEFAAKFGIDARSDYQKHIVYGDPPMPDHETFGPQFKWVPISYQRFDQGIDTMASRISGITQGVKTDGPAYRAGLRDGMKFVRAIESRRPETSSQVIVKEQRDGEWVEREFQFLPSIINEQTGQFVRGNKIK